MFDITVVEHDSTTLDAEREDGGGSNDSGCLTQRAAMIRDELLGNNSLEQGLGGTSVASSATSMDRSERSSQRDSTSNNVVALEDGLSSSTIAHSLRHIEMVFEEKSRELESLRKATETLTAELDELSRINAALKGEIEDLRARIEHQNELLCVSDCINSGLYERIQGIKEHVEAAEDLAPGIRAFPSTCSSATFESNSVIGASTETSYAPTLVNSSPTPVDELIKEIEARYAE